MQSKIIAVDLAKDVFEIAVANHRFRILERHRLSRTQFANFLHQQAPALLLFEACGTAHYWAREATGCGHQPKLIPAHYVKPYRRRGKSDRIDTEAILEAHRCEGIKPVPVRSVDQQQIQQLHRVREQWKRTRTQRINGLRGFLRELGHAIPKGANVAQRHARDILDNADLPEPLVRVFNRLLEEISTLEHDIAEVERQIAALTRTNTAVQRMQSISGIGLLTSTATVACAGSPHHFPTGRHFASWLGITPREYSTANRRRLGRIFKQGDSYLRMLFIQGARSVLIRAKQLKRAGQTLSRLQHWACQVEARLGFNKAACAVANKLARICWAVWKNESDFDPDYLTA